MIRVFGFATVVLCLISLVLLGAMTLLAPHVSPSAAMASARMRQSSSSWFQVLDLDRRLATRVNFPLDDMRDVRLMWDDAKYAYFCTWREDEAANKPLFTYHLYDLSTRQVIPLVQDVKTEERDIIKQSFVQPSPDGRYVALLDFRQRDYYVIDTSTQKLHPLMDFEAPDSTGQPILIPMIWSPTSDHMAFTHKNMLYLVDLPEITVHEFKIAEEGTFYPQWSEAGEKILLTPSQPQQSVRIFDVTTRTFDPRAPNIRVNWVSWGCDDQWLIYNRSSDDPDKTGPSELFNLQTGITRSLNDIPALKDQPVDYVMTLDCEHLLVLGVPAQPSFLSSRIEERPLYILNLITETVHTADDSALFLGWIAEEDTIVYSKAVQEQPGQREVFKRAAKVDSQPERLGAYEAAMYSSLTWASDYSALVQWHSSSGQLIRRELRTGRTYVLTRHGEIVEEVARWQ